MHRDDSVPVNQSRRGRSDLVSIPILIVFFALQKYIIGGLTLGGVKG